MKRTLTALLALAAAGSAAAQPVTVEFWHAMSDPKRSGFIAQKAEAFSKANPGIRVITTPKGSYNDTLQSTILAARQGKPPALVMVVEVGSQLAIDSGVFQPVGAVGNVDYGDYIKPVLNYYTIGGKVNSLPFNSSSPVLFYNKTLMQKAGLDPRRPPTTFGAILKACAKIKAADLDAKCMGFNLHSWFFEQWMAEQGATLVNNDNGRRARATESNLNSTEMKRIFSFLKTLNDNGYYTYTGKLEDWDGSQAIFANQKAVFHVSSTADIGNTRDAAGKSGFDVGVGVFPIPDGTKRNGVVIGGASLWITKGVDARTAEAARDFALYLTNTGNMAEWHKLTGYYPVRDSSVKALRAEGWFSKSPLQIVAFNQLLNTQPSAATAGALSGSFIEMRKIIEEAAQKVLGGQGVNAALADAKTRADRAIATYNSNIR